MKRIAFLGSCVGILGLVLGLALVGAAAAEAHPVFFTKHCGYSNYKPAFIGLTCANNAVILETPSWEVWGEEEAATLGTLVTPDPSCRIAICPKKVRHEVRVTLTRPVFCSSSGHWQFTQLQLDDLTGPLPEGVEETRLYRCADFAPSNHPYHPPHHAPPYWRSCAPIQSVVSGDMLTHRIGCRSARKVIKKVLAKAQTAQSPHVRAAGFVCGLRPYASRPVSCKRGGQRILSPLPG